MTWILAFSILFLIVAMVLINNSIRLKIFSKRFHYQDYAIGRCKTQIHLKTICKRSGDFRIIGAIIGLTALFTGWYFFTMKSGLHLYKTLINTFG